MFYSRWGEATATSSAPERGPEHERPRRYARHHRKNYNDTNAFYYERMLQAACFFISETRVHPFQPPVRSQPTTTMTGTNTTKVVFPREQKNRVAERGLDEWPLDVGVDRAIIS